MRGWYLLVLAVLLAAATAPAQDAGAPKPSAEDKCPVCGMFVHKYPDWVAGIVFKDGAAYFFDGAKDMFKFYFGLDTYAPSRSAADISAMYVTEYYDMTSIEARAAFFVIGSDVYGPMGRELIPLAKRADAEQFRRDHGGHAILEFGRVKPSAVEKLD